MVKVGTPFLILWGDIQSDLDTEGDDVHGVMHTLTPKQRDLGV